jgi:2-polyprenyl-6-methoxyphenol hydroxylase-like FAD-dependent oxidoreductase
MNILVIGGGIGGPTSAIALRGKGFAVDVIERARIGRSMASSSFSSPTSCAPWRN